MAMWQVRVKDVCKKTKKTRADNKLYILLHNGALRLWWTFTEQKGQDTRARSHQFKGTTKSKGQLEKVPSDVSNLATKG